VKTLVRRSHAFRFLGKLASALQDAETALALTDGRNDQRHPRAEALRAKGITLSSLGRSSEGIECLKTAESLYDLLGLEESVAFIRIDLGSIYRIQRQYRESLYAYESALEYLRKAGDLPRQATVMNNLGVLHHTLGEFEKAASDFEKAISCATQSGYTRIEALTLASIGDLYIDLDAPDAAQDAYVRGFEIANRIHDRFLKFYLSHSQGIAERKLGNLDKAAEWLELATDIAGDSHSASERGLCHIEAGRQAKVLIKSFHAPQVFEGSTDKISIGKR
jgi:tetratricopeptide (TPR) repeat protein